MKLLAALTLLTAGTTGADPVKVACVGDSITQGVGVADPKRDSYPAVLGELLGRNYEVRNFGFSGATLLKEGNNPYWKTSSFRDATKFAPNIVIIALGTNDSKTINWDGREAQFRPDYEALIAHFAEGKNDPKIFLCLPPPSLQQGDGDIRERILVRQRQIIRQLAADRHLKTIDLARPFSAHPNWLPDGVHPDESGANAIAKVVAAALRR